MTSELLATTPTEEIEEDPLLLYQPLGHRINPKKIPWTITYERVTAKQAQQWLDEAAEYRGFGQRNRTPAAVTRWKELMQTNRFVEYLPLGGLCFNEDGVIMNGGNRLVAQVQLGIPLGYTIIRDCPTWMLPYFDNGKMRTAKEARQIMLRDPRPDAQNILKLAMRYEEFLFGKRGTLGWVNWSRQRDEHADTENFEQKRSGVLDYLDRGKKLRVKLNNNFQVSAGACFIFYQQLAWPDGSDALEQFLDGLMFGANLDKGNPALVLREWARSDAYIGEGTRGRREGHLLLLFKHFLLFAEGERVPKVLAARGIPMSMPYHPDGWDVGCKNAREALLEMG